jgi:hypothetical protein
VCVSATTKGKNEETREDRRCELQSQGAKSNDPPLLASKFSCSKFSIRFSTPIHVDVTIFVMMFHLQTFNKYARI